MLQQLTRRNLFIALAAIILLLGIGATTIFLINRSRPGGQTTTPVVRIEAATTAQTGGESGLQIRLSKGQPPQAAYQPLPLAAGTPLSDEETALLLARLPAISSSPGDTVSFQLPTISLAPPRAGATISQPFPPPPPSTTPPDLVAGPLAVLRYAPEGQIPLAPFLNVTFNQPMVPLATLETLAAADVPVRLTPNIPGIWRWLGTQTLTFEYQGGEFDRFPMATEYVAEIPAGTTAANGSTLAESVTWRFTTPPAGLVSHYPHSSPQPLEPIFFLAFDQQIDPAGVLATTHVTANGQPVTVQLATEAEIAADKRVSRLVEDTPAGRWLAFRAPSPLPTDAAINLTIGPGTPSAEGPLLTTTTQSFDFRTYAALKIVEHRCGWSGECPPFTPFFVEFNNPLDPALFSSDMVQITPELPGAVVNLYGSTLQIQGASQGRTTYRVTINSQIADTFGQTLGRTETLTFRVGSAPKALSGPDQPFVTLDPSAPRPVFTVYTVNYDRLSVRAYAVTPADWPAYKQYLRDFYQLEERPTPPGRVALDTTLEIDATADKLTELPIDLSDALGGPYGHLIVVVEPPAGLLNNRDDRYNVVQAWVQATQIGLDAFADHSQLTAWATNLQDGRPLANLSLQLGSASATSDANGLAQFSLDSGGSSLLIAQSGDDSAILPSNPYYWDDSGWRAWPVSDELRWYVFDDRQMYRPGEELHLKGWLRQIGGRQAGDVALPANPIGSVSYRVSDSYGNELATGQAQVTALSGFDLAFTLPDNANLGYANIELTAASADLGRQSYYHGFQIQEFRRPEFEVSATTDSAGPFIVGDNATVSVAASYFAGGPLPNADVTWQVSTRPGSYTPPNWPDFTFGTWTPWWYGYGPAVYEEAFYFPLPPEIAAANTFTGTTDANGQHYLQIDFESLDTPQPFNVTAEASVLDVNRQSWAASTSLLVHPATLYVGLRSERTFVELGQPLIIETIVTNLDGQAIPGRDVTLTAARLDWVYRNGTWAEEAVESQDCTVTSAAEPVTCTFEVTTGGSYQITAIVADEQGRLNQSQFTRWVGGSQPRPERNVALQTVTLIPDKESYQPGETAEILVQAPFSPAHGLLTVSRSGTLYSEPFEMTFSSTTLRVPITEAHLPNLTLQVDLTGSATRTDDAGTPLPNAPDRPAFATGQLTLNVSTASRTLDVQVTPQEARLSPGGSTTIDIRVTGPAGQPIPNAELAVVVVDEAVLALTGYTLADPVSAFYAFRDGGVSSSYGRSSIILANPETLASTVEGKTVEVTRVVSEIVEAPMEQALADTADDTRAMATAAPAAPAPSPNSDEAGAPIQVRSNFNPLAIFAPAVSTNSDGQAQVLVALPDNLTRYRIMVVAAAGENQFGSGEANLTARLPLMVRPSAPRFLNFGDSFELPVVLQNQTDAALDVAVAVQLSNLTLSGSQGLRVTVPANDRVEVRFPAGTLSAGTARIQVAASAGPYADAAELELPVYTPATSEAFATYGVLDGGSVAQPLAPAGDVFPQFGGLEINTSSTALQALTDAVLFLVDYAHYYPEPAASRVLAIAALRDVLTAFAADGLPSPETLNTTVQADLQQLADWQNNDGGFPLWQRGDESIPFHTIHAAHALAQAQLKGYDVPQEALQNALNYLRSIENHYPDWYSDETRHSLSAYALYVRQLAGDTDAAKAAGLLDEAGLENLSLEALAWIWPVLDSSPAYSSQVAAIGRHFDNRAVETASAANFTTSYGDQAYLMLHSDRRTDGVVLNSLIRVRPDSDLIPKVVNGLLANQTRGRWNNTQENVFILLALDRYFNTFEAQTPDFVARIWLGDTYLGESAFVGRTTERHETMVPMSYLVDNFEGDETQDLVLQMEGSGRLYYRLGLRYAPTDLQLDPLDMGFVVQRTYEAVDNPADVYQDPAGTWHIAAGARVRVRIALVTNNRRYHVALVDPLPAGLEIINPALAVSGSVPQDPNSEAYRYGWWWWGTWYEHQNLRDTQAEALTSLLWEGVYSYSYVTRATTPGTFVVPPAHAEELYSPEVFGRSASDLVIVE
ncbi:MAG: hypothetical protein H6666_00805 [Ardenticatenaceae bacterium]|nr:hypothetical protein [Ardenticatenaceae bacterium]